ncbi:twin-arginine translocase subunit TatC [Rhodobacteraceae bacterium]|nr:twin-arginine translocase subunit TatC [Paracoccaceae bacterium]
MSDATEAPDDVPEDEVDASSAPLLEHLSELRTRLIKAVIAFVIGIVVAFTVAEPILQILLKPIEATLRGLGDPAPALQFTSPQEYLFTLFRISMVFGFALSFPVIAHQLWRFVAPGLYKTEKAAFLPFIIASPVMFLIGASFALFVVVPLAMQFLLGFADFSFSEALSNLAGVVGVSTDGVAGALPEAPRSGLEIIFFGKVNESLDLTLKFIMAFGLCFQLPVLLTLMGKAGLVSARGLANVRKYAMVGILLLAALVTPPDVITQLILFVVVYGLYEISIQLVRMVEKKRVKKLREEGILGEDEDLYSEFDDDEEDEDPKS